MRSSEQANGPGSGVLLGQVTHFDRADTPLGIFSSLNRADTPLGIFSSLTACDCPTRGLMAIDRSMTGLLRGLSRRVRLALAIVAAVLPFVAVLVFANLWVYRPLQQDIEVIADDIQSRFEDVSRLQLLLSRSAMPPNDFLIHGGNDERIRFELIAGQVESLFGQLIRNADFGHPNEKQRLSEMTQRWAVARQMGTVLLGWPVESRLTDGAAAMERFDREVDQLTEEAESLLAHVRLELEAARDDALRRRHDLNRFVALATAMAGILTLLLVTLLTRDSRSAPVSSRSGAAEAPVLPEAPAIDAPVATSHEADLAPARDLVAGTARPAEHAVDPLTRLWSRGSLQRQLAIETERAMVLETPSSLAIVEIDGFDQLTEQYGEHLLSALVLAVADRVRHVSRSTDFPARTSTGEFAVLMPATDVHQATEIDQRLRAQIADTPVSIGRRTASVTVSIGVAGDSLGRAGQVGASTLLGRADQAVHRARRAGGNRVERSGA